MCDLKVKIGKIELRNPVICSSGCCGHAYELEEYMDLSRVGAFSIKSVTLEPRKGNPLPRIHEISSGMMSSIGLQNPGIEVYLKEIMPRVRQVLRPDQIFASVAGSTKEDYIEIAKIMNREFSPEQIAALEINAACPNVHTGGGAVAKNPDQFYDVLNEIVKNSRLPVIAKIPTDFDCFCDSARAAEAAGVQAVYTTNTPVGMAIDIRTGKTRTGRPKAPMSGPVIKPLGIASTWDLYKAVHIPVIASGGIFGYEDAVEYLMAGATGTAIGSATFTIPDIAVQVVDGMEAFARKRNLKSIHEIIGLTHRI